MVWVPKEQAPAKAIITSYQPTFITYLSRFLLNYDRSSANWWRDQLRDLPLNLERRQLTSIRERQFGQFSESVEVGLQRYQGKAGVRALFSFLKSRYGTTAQAKLQLALLFSIISPRNQPSALIRRALGQADNGVVTEACVLDGGRGYSSLEKPAVTVSAPDGGGASAVVRAELAPTGQLLSIALRKGGSGYLSGDSPTVKISPPSGFGSRPAQAVARVQDGRVVSLELVDRGRGFRTRDVVEVTISPPRNELGVPIALSVAAEASVELESGVVRLVLEDGGEGYARDQRLTLDIEPPANLEREWPESRMAIGKLEPLKLAFELEALKWDGPYTEYYPEDSVSAELLRLLPSTVRPARQPDGTFTLPIADPSALREALDLNGGRRQGLDLNMVSYKYAASKSSGLRQKLPFAVDRDPTFGPLGTSPAQREVSLTTQDYLAFAASGAACTSLVRTALVPLDVAKTLMQSSPEKYPALRPAFASLWAQGGLPSLYRSIDVTAVAGLLLGGFGFGVNEFLRRYLSTLGGPQAQTQYSLQIAIGAALGSVIAVCLVTTPFEVLRIRAIEAANADMSAYADEGAGFLIGGMSKTFKAFGAKGGFQAVMAGFGGGSIDTSDAGLEKLFTQLDADEGGSISRDEIVEAITKLYGVALDPSLVEQMMNAADTDNSGEIDLDEFKTIMRAEIPADATPWWELDSAAPVATAAASTPMQLGDTELIERLERLWQINASSTEKFSDVVVCDGDKCFLAPPPPPASAYNMVNGLGTLYAEGGLGTLYSALTPLLLRELPFSITKFLVYDSSTQAIAAAFPVAQEGPLASALLSLTGGLAAGVVAAAVSTPADTLLTLSQTPPPNAASEGGARAEPPTMLQLGKDMVATNPLALFSGLLPRCLFFGALIAGQFLLYDYFKRLFNVGSDDITFYLDVFASTDLSFWPRT